MSKGLGYNLRLDRIESLYLSILRVGILTVATICLVAALGFAIDGLWRILVSTKVEETPVAVTATEVASTMRASVPVSSDRSEPQIPQVVKDTHDRFVRTVFSVYYQTYRQASETYKKPEDQTLNSADLMSALGYDLGSYAAGGSLKTKLFIENAVYQQQALAAVKAAMNDPTIIRQLREYKAAGKTAQACSTAYQQRSVWDSSSMVCNDWYLNPVGCQVVRSVPVERCVPAYPDGIVSPRVAFGRADEAFADLWQQKTDSAKATADAERAHRFATRSEIGPRLMTAFKIIGGFLVVMFFFLLIAVERHLRKVSEGSLASVSTTDASAAAVEPDRP